MTDTPARDGETRSDERERLIDEMSRQNAVLRLQLDDMAKQRDMMVRAADDLLAEKTALRAECARLTAGAPSNEAVKLIAAERVRQIEREGWTLDHDDEHTRGEMAVAAACYAWPNPRPLFVKQAWPWDRQWWKPAVPGDRIGFPDEHTEAEKRAARIKDLARAGALIVAEIERLGRAAAPTPGDGT